MAPSHGASVGFGLFLALRALAAAEDAGTASATAAPAPCTITAKVCRNFPEYQRTQFRDALGEEHLGAGTNDAACIKRAEDFHHWCGNLPEDGAKVAASFGPAELSQIYHPGACDKGWSQWDAFCFKHYWEKANWFEAEKLCRERDSHLASVHSRAENRFIYTLTSGLSAWIGYTDLDQDTHFQWSDSTQDDFSNFAKNCTGREEEPDCKPEERKQQWYDWEGGDRGTFVCKRNALLPLSLLRNVTAKDLLNISWDILLPALSMGSGLDSGTARALPATAPELKTPEISVAKAESAATKAAAKPTMPEPRLVVPKGTLF